MVLFEEFGALEILIICFGIVVIKAIAYLIYRKKKHPHKED